MGVSDKTARGAEGQTWVPLLKWAGGKRWLVPTLLPLWRPHQHRRLVEPFVGGLAVTLGLRPRRALLNDRNVHLIHFYRWLQKGAVTTIAMVNDRDLYYRYRARFNHLIRTGDAATDEAAQLFYYLNRTCFNGLCRFNRKGEFNVPFGRYLTIQYTRDFLPYRELFSHWEFTAGDFAAMPLEPDDFVYADPPYDVAFTSYSPGGFAWEDQVRLAEWLANHPGPVVASNQATPRVLRLYRQLGFTIRILDAPRLIACNGNRAPAQEMLAIRNLVVRSYHFIEGNPHA